jgi:hypothetical protein
MTQDQELAQLRAQWPGWHIWRGRNGVGQASGWHATWRGAGRSVILDADGPAELRQQLRDAATVQTGART